jgi:hypothetical protein
MPLWRFKVGDFTSPLESHFGIRPKTISVDGIVERPTTVGWFQRWRARRDVRAICKAVSKANGTPARWNDDGDVVYSRQGHWFEALRAYARWLDCRMQFPLFDPPPVNDPGDRIDYYKHPVWNVEVAALSCPHLVEHDCYSGYYLPCEFKKMVDVEPYLMFGVRPSVRPVGSSPRLLRELDYVQQSLQAPEDGEILPDDPLFVVKDAYLQLRKIAELSCQHGLPVIFYG